MDAEIAGRSRSRTDSKQERKVSELQTELDAEKSMLSKLLQAKKVLEST